MYNKIKNCCAQNWQQSDWAVNLSALLKGKALEVYSRLPVTDASNYDSLKSALLKRYHFTEEGFRNKFRSARADKFESPKQFAVRLDNYFCRWVDLAKMSKVFTGIKDLLLGEQFINACSVDLPLFLKERNPKDITIMAELAEKYIEARGGIFSQDSKLTQSSFYRSDRETKRQSSAS